MISTLNLCRTSYLCQLCSQQVFKCQALNLKFFQLQLRCVVRMVVRSILPHTEFRRIDHRKDSPHFIERNNRDDIELFQYDKPLLWSLNPCFNRKSGKCVSPVLFRIEVGQSWIIRKVGVPKLLKTDSKCQRPVVYNPAKVCQTF